MTYTTLTYQGVEKSLADWGISAWSRTAQNQADDNFTFTIPTPMDGNDIFPYGANIIIKINRATTTLNPINPTLSQSGAGSFSGGTQWFWGYCIDNDRVGQPDNEAFNYKFVGPYQFFFERLIFQKLMLTWNGTRQIADYQSDVVLGLSLTTLTGTGDTIQNTTATNLMSIAQQIKEICMYAQADSSYQQANNGLDWPGTIQFQCDQLTTQVDGINYDLLQTPSANVLIADYAGTPLGGLTSASTLPPGSYILRAPLDAVNAITCKEAMQRELQWLGGIGSPVVWTDHSQTPPQLHIVPRSQLPAQSLPVSGITVKNKIKKRADLVPAAVHFKYKIAGSVIGQPYSVVIDDVAAYLTSAGAPGVAGAAGVSLYEGIGQLGGLTDLTGGALPGAIQAGLMAASKTAASIVQTFDFLGDKVNAASCKITTAPLDLVDPAGKGSDQGFWATLFPELLNCSNVKYFSGPTIVDAATPSTVYYSNGLWTGTPYINRVTDGQVAPWMLAAASTPANPVAGQTVKAKLTVRFQYTQNTQGAGAATATQGIASYHEKNIIVTLTTLGSGTYYSAPSVSVGEPVPYGLAGYILALESIPQYEGSVLVQETEISDVCPIGNALNITGGLAEWSTMAACVQSVRYADNGQTEITFGPARHLGPAQFIARFRTNTGPRWYNLIGSDPMNQASPGATTLGSNIPADAPSPGGRNYTFLSFLTSLAAQQSSSGGAATLPAGVHIDTGANMTPFTGAVPGGVTPFAGPGPNTGSRYGLNQALVIAQGPNGSTPGESMAWIRLSLGDLQNGAGAIQNKQIFLQEVPVCVNVGGTLTQMYQIFLCSNVYATSIG